MKRLFLLILFAATAAHAQGVRVPLNIVQEGTIAGVTNAVEVPPAPIVAFCNAPANAVPCTNKATTYTDSTLGTVCPTSTQIVLDGTNACVANLNINNQGGVWVNPGQYAFTVTVGGANFGPFFVTAGGSSGGGGGGISGGVSGNLIKATTPTTGTDSGISAASVVTGAPNIAAGQVAFGTGSGVIGGSNNLTYISNQFYLQNTACSLTPIGLYSRCGSGLGTSYAGAPVLDEVLLNTATPWAWVGAVASAAGNSGSSRGSFIGLTGAADTTWAWQRYQSGTFRNELLFDNSGAIAIQTSNADATSTEIIASFNGGVDFLTDVGKGACLHGTTSGQACLSTPATGLTLSSSEQFIAPSLVTGTGASAAGATASGGFACAEATNTGWTPTAGQDYQRCDSTLHEFVCSVNGGAETACGGGGSPTFSAITSGTNTTAAMVLGSGSSLASTGTAKVDLSAATGNTSGNDAFRLPSGAFDISSGSSGAIRVNSSSGALEVVLGTDLAYMARAGTGTGGTTCTNQVVTAINSSTAPTCSSLSIGANTSQKSESAADSNVLTFTPPAVAGSYRIGFVLSISAAASAVVGWTATWKDSNSAAQTPTNLSFTQSGTAAPALTFTTSSAGNYYGEARIDVDNSATNVVIKFTLGSGTITAKASATVERII